MGRCGARARAKTEQASASASAQRKASQWVEKGKGKKRECVKLIFSLRSGCVNPTSIQPCSGGVGVFCTNTAKSRTDAAYYSSLRHRWKINRYTSPAAGERLRFPTSALNAVSCLAVSPM